MHGSLKNQYKNFEMCQNFFGWGILEIMTKNSIFSIILAPKTYCLGQKIIFGLKYVDFRGVLLLIFSDSTKISLQYSTKISYFFWKSSFKNLTLIHKIVKLNPTKNSYQCQIWFLTPKISFWAQKIEKNWVFWDYLQNPPSKKVVTHLKIFVWVFERPMHWWNACDISFFLIFLLAGCDVCNITFLCIVWY